MVLQDISTEIRGMENRAAASGSSPLTDHLHDGVRSKRHGPQPHVHTATKQKHALHSHAGSEDRLNGDHCPREHLLPTHQVSGHITEHTQPNALPGDEQSPGHTTAHTFQPSGLIGANHRAGQGAGHGLQSAHSNDDSHKLSSVLPARQHEHYQWRDDDSQGTAYHSQCQGHQGQEATLPCVPSQDFQGDSQYYVPTKQGHTNPEPVNSYGHKDDFHQGHPCHENASHIQDVNAIADALCRAITHSSSNFESKKDDLPENGKYHSTVFSGPTVTFPKFYGKKGESFESWLEDLDETFTKLDIITSDDKLRAIPEALEGRAKQIFRKLIATPDNSTFEQVLSQLTDTFGIQSKSPSEIYKDVELSQGDMSVSEYCEKLFDKLKHVPMFEIQKMHIFEKGLNSSLKILLATQDYSTYSEIEKCALKLEDSAKNLNENIMQPLAQISADVNNIATSNQACNTSPSSTHHVPSRRDHYNCDYKRQYYTSSSDHSPSRKYYRSQSRHSFRGDRHRYRSRSPSPYHRSHSFDTKPDYNRRFRHEHGSPTPHPYHSLRHSKPLHAARIQSHMNDQRYVQRNSWNDPNIPSPCMPSTNTAVSTDSLTHTNDICKHQFNQCGTEESPDQCHLNM